MDFSRAVTLAASGRDGASPGSCFSRIDLVNQSISASFAAGGLPGQPALALMRSRRSMRSDADARCRRGEAGVQGDQTEANQRCEHNGAHPEDRVPPGGSLVWFRRVEIAHYLPTVGRAH